MRKPHLLFPVCRTLTVAAATWIAAALASPAAMAADRQPWKAISLDCMATFAAPDKADEAKLFTCADGFAAEAVLESLTANDKTAAEKGLRHLYDKGSDKSAKTARLGLQRLGINLPFRAARPAGEKATATPDRAKYDPPEAKDADKKAAEKLYKDGLALLKKKKWKEGVAILTKGLEKNPRSEKILYNMACGEANLPGDKKPCWTNLQHLSDLGSDYAAELLIKARTDADYEGVREEADFKRMTGYMRVQVVNTVGDVGDPGVENILKLFDKLGHRKPDKKDDESAPQPAPTIQFKAHAKAQVAVIAELLNDQETKLDPIQMGDSKYDMVIRWGTKIDEKGKPINLGPDTADEAMAGARKKQNKALAQPEQAIGKVNKVIDTPNRVISEAGKMKDRVLGVGDKAKGAADKVKDLGSIGDKAKDAVKIKGL
ncbi:MAG: hypothetical protein EXR77_10865 [Myxococcales bacterium]|nr:hypothetical protein [Myxococcales bacterium]